MEILHTTEILTEGWGVIAILAIIGAILTAIFGLLEIFCGDEKSFGVILVLICAILVTVTVGIFTNTDRITQHKVVITDMSDFDTERYEIIETEGRIFTINEKEAGQ